MLVYIRLANMFHLLLDFHRCYYYSSWMKLTVFITSITLNILTEQDWNVDLMHVLCKLFDRLYI